MENAGVKAGFAMVDITPPLGVCMAGYYRRREATGILDPLYASALSISNGEESWILISCDVIGLGDVYVAEARDLIEEKVGVPKGNIMIHSTHTHTGPVVRKTDREGGQFTISERDDAYLAMLVRKISDAAQMAVGNMKEVTVEVGYGHEDTISFIRRFRMKNGEVRTNPGMGNPDIDAPIGEIDPSVGVVRLRSVEDEILLVNFALHADIIGGTLLSADFPGHMRQVISKQMPLTKVLFINGTAGDINHADPMHPGRTSGGYEYSRKVGTKLAAEVLKVYQRMTKMDKRDMRTIQEIVTIPLRKVSAEEAKEAKAFIEGYFKGEVKLRSGMLGTSDLSKAYRTMDLAKREGQMEMELQVLTLGDIAFLALPGEVFAKIGRRIKEASPYPHTFIAAISNGSFGYFPTKDAFSEGGYESSSSPFTPELENILVENFLRLLNKAYG
jgi:neutral ceramidase